MARNDSNAAKVRLHLNDEHSFVSSPLEEDMVLLWARKIIKRRFKRQRITLTRADKVSEYLVGLLGGEEREIFGCLFLSNDHQLLAYRELFFGTINQAMIYPREVVKAALELNAAAVVAVHNHPSGLAEPSTTDRITTQELSEALALVDIRLLDHMIVAGTKTVFLLNSFPKYRHSRSWS